MPPKCYTADEMKQIHDAAFADGQRHRTPSAETSKRLLLLEAELKELSDRFQKHSMKEQRQSEQILRALFGESDPNGQQISKGLLAKVDDLYVQFIQDKGVWKRIGNFITVGAAMSIVWTVITYLVRK